MSDVEKKSYPDVSDILALKAEGRRDRARMSFVDKLAWLETMRERLAPFRQAREARQMQQTRRASRGD